MIQMKTLLNVIDNSGALIVECINVIGRRSRIATIGDEIVVSVKKARTLEATKQQSQQGAKLRRGEVGRAVIVRTKKEIRRKDGTYIKFDEIYLQKF